MAWNKKTDLFALMVGHGKSLDGTWDPGCAYSKYTEAGLMLEIVKVAVKWLRKSGVKVLTDADDANNRNMKASVAWANNRKAKKYMSVHCDYSGATAGVMPLYKTLADKRMADKIGKYVAKQMGMKYKGASKRTDLYELNATNMTSVIFETGAIKADLKKLKDAKKYGKVLAKGICRYIGVDFYVSTKTKLLRKAAYIVSYMNNHHFKYDHAWRHCGTSWAEAKKTKKCNCHLMVNFALQEIGILKPGQIFWLNGTKVVCKGAGTKARVKKYFDITHPKKAPSGSKLKKADICGYEKNAHTQMYAGKNKDKKPVWYSWGPSDVGKKEPRRRKMYDSKKIMTKMRLK